MTLNLSKDLVQVSRAAGQLVGRHGVGRGAEEKAGEGKEGGNAGLHDESDCIGSSDPCRNWRCTAESWE